jgi:hypothetical protein
MTIPTLHIDLGRHPHRIRELAHDSDGNATAWEREHKSGRVDVKVLVPTAVHRMYDHAPEENAAFGLRFPQLVDPRRLPWSKETIAIMEDVTGRRYVPPQRSTPCPT